MDRSNSENAYDLIIIGGGSAGSVAAASAVSRGARVAMIERWKIGGTCLNVGCDPTKELVRSAEVMHLSRHADQFGIRTSHVDVAWPIVMNRVQHVINTIRGGDGDQNVRDSGVVLYKGHGRFRSPHEIEVNGSVLVGDKVIIASGAREVVPAIDGLREAGYITNVQAVALPNLPASLAIIGGGTIGAEFAQIFARFGVIFTVVGSRDRLLPREDPDLASALEDVFRREGIRIETGAQISYIRQEDGIKILSGERDGERLEVRAEEILVATGRTPAVHGFGLEAAGVDYRDSGIVVDEYLCTTADHIWAAGDVTGRFPFTHVADYQARIAEANALSGDAPCRFNDHALPWATFTDPELARVGLTEQQAIEKGYDAVSATVKMRDTARAMTSGETDGLVKLVADRATGQILGGHILAAGGGELVGEVALAMRMRLLVSSIAETVHPYPTYSEAVFWAAHELAQLIVPTVVTGADLLANIREVEAEEERGLIATPE